MFHAKGRINRTTFLLGNLYLAVLVLPFYAVDEKLLEQQLEANTLLSILTVFLVLCVLYFSINLLIRRLHDLGLSGWFALMTLLPGVQLVLLVLPGQKTKNNYGAPPTKRFNSQTLFSS